MCRAGAGEFQGQDRSGFPLNIRSAHLATVSFQVLCNKMRCTLLNARCMKRTLPPGRFERGDRDHLSDDRLGGNGNHQMRGRYKLTLCWIVMTR